MDYCQNFSLSQDQDLGSDYHQQCQPEQLLDHTLDDLFPSHTTTEEDVSLEWLSVFVEDCLSSSGNCLPPPAQASSPKTTHVKNKLLAPYPFLHKFVIPGKARSKRKRRTPLAQKSKHKTFLCSWPKIHKNQVGVVPFLDPPLLQQAYWLADSELIIKPENKEENKKEMVELEENCGCSNGQQQQGRRCSHCLSQKTPQWRAGPLGPKTLCNACGVRYKKGRLFPEYRPAKSPTFVSYKHSNSHKKVLEMRSMAA